MKQVVVICDGMADEPLDILGGKTPLEAADTPAMDQLAQMGRTGSLRTIPDGKYPGSEVGIMTILGYAPQQLPWGRGALEAIGLDIALNPDEFAMRYILKSPEEFNHDDLAKQISAGKTHPLSDTTGLCIVPYTYSDCITNRFVRFWSRDRLRSFPTFAEIHSSHFNTPHPAAIVGAVPLLKGIAIAVGADWIKPDGATGDLSTDYRAKGLAAIKALDSHDIVIVHIEACDWASHHKDPMAKVKAIENIDKHIIYPLINLFDGLLQCTS
ncbi:MAG: hypothetical protein K2K97_09580, partial [Muribaculaceae bacterium]|nr:hypothetical protein [Muribaculaceae bacterium]